MLAVLESTCEVLGAALVLTTHDESISARYQQQWRIVDGALDRGGPS
jgi:predicted ABC-type transport system involved in lysophospholipase L1 biosynthesis ATPase subunit